MYQYETLLIILGTLGFMLIIMCPFIINKITKYKLELERMRIEADIRKEEIRARNQLELDKYIADEHIKEKNGMNAEAGRKTASAAATASVTAVEDEPAGIFIDRTAARSSVAAEAPAESGEVRRARHEKA